MFGGNTGVGVPVGLVLLRCGARVYVWDRLGLNTIPPPVLRGCVLEQLTQNVINNQVINQASNKAIALSSLAAATTSSGSLSDTSSSLMGKFKDITSSAETLVGQSPTTSDFDSSIISNPADYNEAPGISSSASSSMSTGFDVKKDPVASGSVGDEIGGGTSAGDSGVSHTSSTSTSGASRATCDSSSIVLWASLAIIVITILAI